MLPRIKALKKLSEPLNSVLAGLDLRLIRRSSYEEALKDAVAMPPQLDPNARSFRPGTWVLTESGSGLRIWIDLGDLGVSHPVLHGNYEPDETAFLTRTLRPGMTFVDVGANIGWFSLNGARAVGPEGRVISFEPRLDLMAHLKRSAGENGLTERMSFHAVALGAEPGTSHMAWEREGANAGGSWLMLDAAIEEDARKQGRHDFQQTPIDTLDRLVGDLKVDVIKIDIEGAEPGAMRGAQRLLERNHPLVLSEVNAHILPVLSHVQPAEYIDWFRQFGYRAYLLEQGEIGPEIAPGTAPAAAVTNVVFR